MSFLLDTLCPAVRVKTVDFTASYRHERSDVTVEMVAHEARHGRGLEGLLKRYFG